MSATVLSRNEVSVRSRVESASRRRTKARAIANFVQALWAFAILSFFTHVAVSMAGHMLAEGERTKIKSLNAALNVARESERMMKAASTQEQSVAAVDQWAQERGFISVSQPSPVYVAAR